MSQTILIWVGSILLYGLISNHKVVFCTKIAIADAEEHMAPLHDLGGSVLKEY